MPRVTRAALRAASAADIHHDEDTNSTSASDSSTTAMADVTGPRPALGEVTGNNTPTPERIPLAESDDLIKTNTTMATKKGNGGRKNKLQLAINVQEDGPGPEILEDEVESDQSSAADAASEELLKEVRSEEVMHVPMDSERPKTPPSAAAREATRQLSRSPVRKVDIAGTPRFDPAIHIEEPAGNHEEKEDSFVGSIHTRTPAKRVEAGMDAAKGEGEEDSFVGKIASRSPTKPICRIEDSVEAIDALEEALEQVTQGLPAIEEDNLDSPIKTKKPGKTVLTVNARPKTSMTPSSGVSAREKPAELSKSKPKPVPTKSARPRPTSIIVTKKENTAVKEPIATATEPRTGMSFSASPARPVTKPRPASMSLSTNRPGFVPSKSSKQPTRATFTLPGEAIAAKMKAQREERLKREAEAEAEKRNFKARPVRSSIVGGSVAVKPTAASRARESLMTVEKNKEIAAPTPPVRKRTSVVAIRASTGNSGSLSKRHSTVLSVAKRPGAFGSSTAPTANTSVTRAPSMVTHSGHRTSSVDSKTGYIPASTKSNVTKADAAVQKARAKQIFGRDKAEKEERERARREKEEAARKARVEAAERGRVASRDWAEKQKAKKLGHVGGSPKEATIAAAGKASAQAVVH